MTWSGAPGSFENLVDRYRTTQEHATHFTRLPHAAARMLWLTCALLLAGCDSGTPWRSGPYALLWIDLPEEVRLSYYMGNGAWAQLIEPRVFAVGANDRYIVAKQHPGGNKSITNYFIIDIRAGAPSARSNGGVVGPLTGKAFAERATQLSLPPFTKTLASLE
jgi:hypothetical protein